MTVFLSNVDVPASLVLLAGCVLVVFVGCVLVGLGVSSSGRSSAAARQPRRSGGAR